MFTTWEPLSCPLLPFPPSTMPRNPREPPFPRIPIFRILTIIMMDRPFRSFALFYNKMVERHHRHRHKKRKTSESPPERIRWRPRTRDGLSGVRGSSCRSVEEYQKIATINEGTYGIVFKAYCQQTREMYALKKIKRLPELLLEEVWVSLEPLFGR